MSNLDHTHQPEATSWVESANSNLTDFPIQNLPFCVFSSNHSDGDRIGVGIGDQILDLKAAVAHGLVAEPFRQPLQQPTLNSLMSLSVTERIALRHAIFDLLCEDSSANRSTVQSCLISQDSATLKLPSKIGDYTDFYASIHHATNVGCMFRPDNPILPNYKHIPIGYHGRASSVVVSGTEVRRPVGQKTPAEGENAPTRSPAALLDYELEVGFFVAQGNELGKTIPIEQAEDHIFGLCLVNDWSARDIQKWEYVPLGPFLAKSFATTISPWIVTIEALAPFRCPEYQRPAGDPAALDYLSGEQNQRHGGIDLNLEVYIATEEMRAAKMDPVKLTSGKFTEMYWTIAQMLTHHASNGCNLQPGDLMASGTVSGQARESRGSMLELTWDGGPSNPLPGTSRTPITLPTGEERKFIGDGDEIIFKAFCDGGDSGNHKRIGFGICAGVVLPADV